MAKSVSFINKLAEINADIETAIAKILIQNKIKDNDVKIGTDENGVRCVLYNGYPIRKLHAEDNITILENLEQQMYDLA